jgi:hypothetical protein
MSNVLDSAVKSRLSWENISLMLFWVSWIYICWLILKRSIIFKIKVRDCECRRRYNLVKLISTRYLDFGIKV